MLITNQNDLLTNRASAIRSILEDIASKKINIQQISLRPKIVFAVSDTFEKGQDYTDWRFRTFATNYKASYYEIWITNNNISYFLSKAYFHLYCIDDDYYKATPNGEYLLLHCDPDDDDLTHGIYKKNPHLHIKTAKHPLPHAHIALNLYSADQIYANLDEFSKSIKQSIKMIGDQIINRLI
jgi:hypothetical protein